MPTGLNIHSRVLRAASPRVKARPSGIAFGGAGDGGSRPMNLLEAALAGAAAGGAAVWAALRGRQAVMVERIRSREAELARVGLELEAERAARQALVEKAARLEAGLAAEQAAHERLLVEFKALSADALRANRADFLEQAAQTFAHFREQSAGESEQRRQAVEALVRPLRESLEKVGAKMTEIDQARAAAYGALSEQLKALGVAQLQLQAQTAQL